MKLQANIGAPYNVQVQLKEFLERACEDELFFRFLVGPNYEEDPEDYLSKLN